jgi:hypothetical protein
MRQHQSRFGAIAGATWLLGVALACSDDPNCTNHNECAFFEDALEEALNESDRPCESLGDAACQRSDRCVMDSICGAPACSGPGCSGTCELVRACVPY